MALAKLPLPLVANGYAVDRRTVSFSTINIIDIDFIVGYFKTVGEPLLTYSNWQPIENNFLRSLSAEAKINRGVR